MEDKSEIISHLVQSIETIENNKTDLIGSFKTLLENTQNEEILDDIGTGRAASLDCNDVHSVFAFIAFLFALLNFIINMQGQGRKKRDTEDCNDLHHTEVGHQ